MSDLLEWANETFPSTRNNPLPPIYHLRKEVDELIEDLEFKGKDNEDTKYEYADCMILLLQSASKYGMSTDDLLTYTRSKMDINKKRTWNKPDENGVYLHVKTSDL